MAEDAPRHWTVHLNREEYLVFHHVSAESEEDAIDAAVERYESDGEYTLEDSGLIAASASLEDE